jgi:hypothetical protein
MPDFNDLLRYFDLQSGRRPEGAQMQAGDSQHFPVFPQYCALVLGIFVQPFLAEFQKAHAWNLAGWQSWIIFSALVGIVILPSVYKQSFDRSSNLFVQLCTIFVSGLGWQSLMQTAVKVIAP